MHADAEYEVGKLVDEIMEAGDPSRARDLIARYTGEVPAGVQERLMRRTIVREPAGSTLVSQGA